MITRPETFHRSTAVIAAGIVSLLLLPAQGALVNRYTFNDGTAVDTINAANGTLTGTASIGFDGRLNLTGGGAGNSYLDLPNGIASSAITGGTSGAFSFEIWSRSLQNANWASLASFGGATDHENDNDGPNKDYIQLIPQNGATGGIRATTHAIANATEGFVDSQPALSTSVEQHMVVVLNQTAGLPGTIDLYVDGAHAGQSPIANGLNLATMVDNNNWLGRSQWGDSSFNGTVDELRIYNHALTPQEVAASYTAGPALPTLLTLVVNKVSGLTSIRNDATIPLNFEYYEVASAGGALNPGGWNSLDNQNIDAIDGSDPDTIVGNAGTETWEEAGGADNFLLSELFVQAGSTLSPGASLNLGAAFNPAVFGAGNDGDLSFTFGTTGGNFLIKTAVEYVTGSGPEGDFDGDGDVDGADFLRWQRQYNTLGQAGLTQWKANYGSGNATAAAAAVPEPTTLVFLLGLVACVGGRGTKSLRHALVLVVSSLVCLSSTGFAASTNDRLYRFGEDDESPTLNSVVGSGFLDPTTGYPTTFDSVGESFSGNFQDLFTKTDVFGNDPVYVAPANPNLPGSTRAASFDGSDFLFGRRLGQPSSSDPAVDNPANGDDTDLLAPEDYRGISNRGFELWVKPGAVGTAQSVVMDTNQHGLRISPSGKWSMRYNGRDFDSAVDAVVGQWAHLAVVRPAGDASGSRLYLNGIAITAAPGGYDGGANARLVVGANTNADETLIGMSEFFTGVVDELEMFVLGTTNATPAIDYGTFNPGQDIPAIASALAGKPQGDINLDGNVNATDVNILIANWLTDPKVFNNVAVGDLDTYKLGDLNFSGSIDLDDAFTLHQGLQLAGGVGLNFDLLRAVPEPTSLGLLMVATSCFIVRRRF